MHYTVSYDNPASQFVNFELEITAINSKTVELQLPSWRPGRYTLQNFAKNIHQFEVESDKGKKLQVEKISKDRWEVQTKGIKCMKVTYSYYASQMDAGGSWLDEQQLYINWITCGLQVIGRTDEPYTITLKVPESYRVATSLGKHKGKLTARNFYELVDSPIIASANLQHKSYKSGNCKFHLWILGDCKPNWEKIINDFKAFSDVQIASFGSFPTEEYHFMFQILPYRHYHGVEHQHSTVIVLGPSEDFGSHEMYQHVLGISSHELYHTWNVTRLRAKEMVPYQYDRENYSRAGFILEGVTTYFGDLMLRRANIWNDEEYLKEFNNLLKRHYSNIGRSKYSLADSSFDLWLDGYTGQEPRRVSSIYIKGALCAFILDILLRKATQNGHGLDELMRRMWTTYGKDESGYTIDDYIKQVEKLAGKSFKNYFERLIFGTVPLEKYLAKCLKYLGYQLVERPSGKKHETLFGFRIVEKNSKLLIQATMPNSPSHKVLYLQDELVAIHDKRVTSKNIDTLCEISSHLPITVFRNNLLFQVTLESTDQCFWSVFEAQALKKRSKAQKKNRKLWMTASC